MAMVTSDKGTLIPAGEFKARSRGFVRSCLREAASSGALAGVGVEEGEVLVLGAIHMLAHAGTSVVPASRSLRAAGRVWAALERLFRGAERRAS